jgi:hypothetical protein
LLPFKPGPQRARPCCIHKTRSIFPILSVKIASFFFRFAFPPCQ